MVSGFILRPSGHLAETVTLPSAPRCLPVCVFCGSREMGIKRPTRARSAALHVPGDSPGPFWDLARLSLGSQAQVWPTKARHQRQQVALFSSPIMPFVCWLASICFFGWAPVPAGQEPGGVLYVCGLVFPPTWLLKASSDRARNDKLAVSSCFGVNALHSWSYSSQRPTYVRPFVSQTDGDIEAALSFVGLMFSDLQLFKICSARTSSTPVAVVGLEQVLVQKRKRERASHFDTLWLRGASVQQSRAPSQNPLLFPHYLLPQAAVPLPLDVIFSCLCPNTTIVVL